VLYSGRLCVQKGPDLLLEAVPGLLRHYPNAKFVFAGDGHMRGDLERRSQQPPGFPCDAVFLVTTMARTSLTSIRLATWFGMPSRNEPFGISALEGWAAGKPVVASQNGGPSEFICTRHRVKGLCHRRVGGLGLGNIVHQF